MVTTQDITINSLEDVIKASKLATQNMTTNAWWWRGLPDENYSLLPGVLREQIDLVLESDKSMIFMQGALARHEKCPRKEEFSRWLFLMQHHGLKTRLMDWTLSPFIALFFVIWKEQEKCGSLCALNPGILNENQYGKHDIPLPHADEVIKITSQAFSPGPHENDKIIALSPDQVDPRMLLQFSRFTIHGGLTPLDQMPNAENFLMKFSVSANAKPKIEAQLVHMGIRLSNLFPDLDHLALDFNESKYNPV